MIVCINHIRVAKALCVIGRVYESFTCMEIYQFVVEGQLCFALFIKAICEKQNEYKVAPEYKNNISDGLDIKDLICAPLTMKTQSNSYDLPILPTTNAFHV